MADNENTENTQGLTEVELKEFSDLAGAGVAEARFGDRSVRMQSLDSIRAATDARVNKGKQRVHRTIFSKALHRK